MSEESRPDRRTGESRRIFHYTDKSGYNAIRAQPDWRFQAHQPPKRDPEHPPAAYFTTLGPDTPNLERLRLPREKRQFVFIFEDRGDLIPIRGGRGQYILYSPGDYVVVQARQIDSGPAILSSDEDSSTEEVSKR